MNAIAQSYPFPLNTTAPTQRRRARRVQISEPAKPVPAARFSVRLIDDEDYVALMQRGAEGREAFSCFVALTILAKSRRNRGEFVGDIEVVAALVRVPASTLSAAIETISAVCRANGTKPWISRKGGKKIVVRSFERYNVNDAHGGARAGAGRKSKGIQVDCNLDSSAFPPSSSSNARAALNPEAQSCAAQGDSIEGKRAARAELDVHAITKDPEAALIAEGVEPPEAATLARCVTPERVLNAVSFQRTRKAPDNPTRAYSGLLLGRSQPHELTEIGKAQAAVYRRQRQARKSSNTAAAIRAVDRRPA